MGIAGVLTMELEKASITNLESLETFTVLWNPERYAVSRRSRLAAPAVVGRAMSPIQAVAGGEQEFTTDLLLDSTRRPAGDRDQRGLVEKLESWMEPVGPRGLPERVLFSWGSFRFRGVLAALDQVWLRFDADGTAVRGWLRITLRS